MKWMVGVDSKLHREMLMVMGTGFQSDLWSKYLTQVSENRYFVEKI